VSAGFRVRRSRPRRTAAAVIVRPGRAHPLVKLVTRVVIAQAAVTAAIGLSFSRRHVPSMIITLMLVVALLGLAAMTRSGTQAAWVFTIGFETAFAMFGVIKFITSRYMGGTLFGIVAMGVLLHPAVARAFSGVPGPADEARPALGEAGADALSGRAAG
jgi:ribose/xylose/arabinose/galactoside ABC-type transport system permease subunit